MKPRAILTNDRNSRKKCRSLKLQGKKFFISICIFVFLLFFLVSLQSFSSPYLTYITLSNITLTLLFITTTIPPLAISCHLLLSPLSPLPLFPSRENPVCYLPVGEESQLSLLCQGRRATSPVIFTTPTLSREPGNGAEWDALGNALYKWPTDIEKW